MCMLSISTPKVSNCTSLFPFTLGISVDWFQDFYFKWKVKEGNQDSFCNYQDLTPGRNNMLREKKPRICIDQLTKYHSQHLKTPGHQICTRVLKSPKRKQSEWMNTGSLWHSPPPSCSEVTAHQRDSHSSVVDLKTKVCSDTFSLPVLLS